MRAKWLIISLTISLQMILIIAIAPADHLMPPPLPATQIVKQLRSPPQPLRNTATEPPGIMTRIARWFGFGAEAGVPEQQLGQASHHYSQYKELPYQLKYQQFPQQYPPPIIQQQFHQIQHIKHIPLQNTFVQQQQLQQLPPKQQQQQPPQPQPQPQQHQQSDSQQASSNNQPQGYQYNRPKAPCNLCNKLPWVPLWPGSVQYPPPEGGNYDQTGSHSIQNHLSHLHFIPQQQLNLPSYPPLNQPLPQYAPEYPFQSPNDHIAVKLNYPPNNVLIGHSGREYSPSADGNNQSPFLPIPLPNLSLSPLPPLFNAIPFNNINQISSSERPFENIASSSQLNAPLATQIPPNDINQILGEPNFEIVQSHPVTDFVSSIEYPANVVHSQVIDLSQNQRPNSIENEVPHLTELGGFSTPSPQNYVTSASSTASQFGDSSIVVRNHYEADNFPSASSHNISIENEPHVISEFSNHVVDDSIFQPTPFSTSKPTTFVTTTSSPIISFSRDSTVRILPSIHTTISQRPNYKKNRDTPKQLLDAPISYIHGGSSPRPFTRDPSDLNIRSSTIRNQIWNEQSPSPTPWTPTSTFSSLDAGGQFAGMSPPLIRNPGNQPQPTEKRPKQIHQIIIPYTTKNKPRPFQPKEEFSANESKGDHRYVNWSQSPDIDPHEQQESKLITNTQTPTRKGTKYLTKILASNLRELLKREHEKTNKTRFGIDLTKLQQNIDDWTEQEFTSLSHKASTVSIRGRSKHIPTEYLTTTTPSMRQSKTTVFDSVSSASTPSNHRGFLYDRESKKYQYITDLIENNGIENSGSGRQLSSETATKTTTTSTTTTTTTTPKPNSYFIHTVSTTQEPWHKVKVSISPQTKEKIYVVTPLPRLHHKTTVDTVGTFKSPRFLVRPTPGGGINSVFGSTIRPNINQYTPQLFGLMGISTYIPNDPVETADGHSKVITVVTPSGSKEYQSKDENKVNQERLSSSTAQTPLQSSTNPQNRLENNRR